MRYEQLQIALSPAMAQNQCVVRSDTRLHEVVSSIDLDCTRHVLVEDENGRLIGIMETDFILRRLNAHNPIERERWAQMPVEAALPGRLAIGRHIERGRESTNPRLFECTAVSGDHGLVAIVTAQDVFVSWQSIQQTLFEARVCPVTQLPTRHAFDRRLREEFERVQRTKDSLAVMLIDVDYFKEVNDSHGHRVGDVVLQTVGGLLQKSLRSYDLVARFGGDEFAAICYGCCPGEIEIPIRRLIGEMQTAFAAHAAPLPKISLSIGAAVIHQPTERQCADDLVELADICLYRAKANGRDCAFRIELHPDMPNLRRPRLVPVSKSDVLPPKQEDEVDYLAGDAFADVASS